jgi:Tfp pilus assembly protein PilF
MRYNSWFMAAVAGSLMLLVAGCASNPKRPALASLAGKSGKNSTSSRAAPAELPPKLAAEICLATAQALEENGYEMEAILQYEKARQRNPRITGVSRRLAVLYDRQNDFPHAVTEYQAAIKANPKDADLLNDFGYFQYERGNLTDSEQWLRRAIATNPKHERAWGNLAMNLGEQGRFDESYDAFTKVVGPAEARSNVAVLMARQGQSDQAKESLRLALATDADLKPAKVLQARLQSE